MRKTLFASVAMAMLLLNACVSDSQDAPEIKNEAVKTEVLTGIQHDIMVNILSTKFGGYHKGRPNTRAAAEISLTPYIENGDTLLYIAQYADGWEIYSASEKSNMILFSSDHGRFDMNDPSMPPAFREMLTEEIRHISDLKADTTKYVHPSWGPSALTNSDLAEGEIVYHGSKNTRSDSDIDYDNMPPGHWVLVETEVIEQEEYTSPKLIVTKWGQDYPWNIYAKWIETSSGYKQAVVGCVAVALSQYMYYTHFKDGVPSTSVSQALMTLDGLDYVFSGASSTIWTVMAKKKTDSGTEAVALLLGDVGRKVNTIYDTEVSVSTASCAISCLISTYNLNFSITDFSFDKVVASIDKGYPLISHAHSSTGTIGHCFIIDQYQTSHKEIRYLYGWEREPWNSANGPDPWDNNDVDEDGNVITWAYTNEIYKTSNTNKISMNWGEDGNYDNIFNYPESSWYMGDAKFDRDKVLYVRPDVK